MGDLSPETQGSPTCLPSAPEPEWPAARTRRVELGCGTRVTVVLLEQMQR